MQDETLNSYALRFGASYIRNWLYVTVLFLVYINMRWTQNKHVHSLIIERVTNESPSIYVNNIHAFLLFNRLCRHLDSNININLRSFTVMMGIQIIVRRHIYFIMKPTEYHRWSSVANQGCVTPSYLIATNHLLAFVFRQLPSIDHIFLTRFVCLP